MSELSQLRAEAAADIDGAENVGALDEIRVRYLGKTGRVTEQVKALRGLAPDARRAAGREVNEIKAAVQSHLQTRRTELERGALDEQLLSERIDVTLPGRGEPPGGLHPLTRTLDRIRGFFGQLGFDIDEGPEIEDDWHNFEALNIPPNHPARAMQDTFYVSDGRVLRTHTSNMQIRYMKETPPPLRLIALGRVYRCDSDQTHTPMFHQCEGLLISEDASFTHLKGMLDDFLTHFFESSLEVRFRPSYFPFTEPSAEVDIRGERGWLEVLGCGMVHPKVLENVGIDSERYTGYAWGMGVERLTMLRYGIDDLRTFFENDMRFLRQFG